MFTEVGLMFLALGLKNAWRNRGRTALGIVSMGIAAMIFLSSTTLSRGYPAGAFMPARQLLGGDIVLLPGKYAISRDDMAGVYTWRFGARSLDQPNLVMGFDTLPYSYGGMRGVPISGSADVTAERYEQVLAELLDNPSVRHASIRKALPFLAKAKNAYYYGFLDARDVEQDLTVRGMESVVTMGSYLAPQDSGPIGVGVAGWEGMLLPPAGSAIVEIPKYAEGYMDYADPVGVLFAMKGAVTFVEGGGASMRVLADPAVFVTPATLDALAAAAGYPEEATYWGISVTLEDMATLENVAAYLRRELPDFTVFAAPALTAAAVGRSTVSTGVPMDMRKVTEVIAFVTAALLSATNLTILMLSRKTEVGILRALGATRWNIACMVITESVWISLLGALVGGLLTQPAILWQLLSNNLGRDVVLREIGGGLGRSVAFAVASAVLFGFLPLTKALSVTPAQVLRGE